VGVLVEGQENNGKTKGALQKSPHVKNPMGMQFPGGEKKKATQKRRLVRAGQNQRCATGKEKLKKKLTLGGGTDGGAKPALNPVVERMDWLTRNIKTNNWRLTVGCFFERDSNLRPCCAGRRRKKGAETAMQVKGTKRKGEPGKLNRELVLADPSRN